jgi:cell division protein FtsB
VKKRASAPASTRSTPRRRRRAIEYVLVFAGCVFLVEGLVGENGFLAMLKARQEYRALEASLSHAREENASLREEARRLREDPTAVEEIARRELGYIRPGEKLFILKDVRPNESTRAH